MRTTLLACWLMLGLMALAACGCKKEPPANTGANASKNTGGAASKSPSDNQGGVPQPGKAHELPR